MQLKQLFAPCSLLLGFMLCAPLAKPGSIVVNGTCYAGTCPLPTDSISDPSYDPGPGSSSGTYNFNVTVNGDIYSVSGAYSASYSGSGGSTVYSNPLITYTGNNGATAQADVITFDYFQNIFDDTPGTWEGDYSESLPLYLSGPAGSTIQGQYLYNGQTVGASSVYGPGTYTYENTSHILVGDTGNNLLADLNLGITFAAGTTAGEGAASATPEPAMAIPAGLGLLVLSYAVRRRNRSRIAA